MSFYVYEHWRPDKNVPFHIGKGQKNRAFQFTRRNRHYNNIVSFLLRQNMKPEVRFVAENLIEDDAFAIEAERIAYWRNLGIVLTNVTDGGGGISGYKHTDDARKKMSIKLLESWTSERRAKISGDNNPLRRYPELIKRGDDHHMRRPGASDKMCGDNNPMRQPGVAEKVGNKLRGRKRPEMTGNNHPIKRNEELFKKFIDRVSGDNNPMRRIPALRKRATERIRGNSNPQKYIRAREKNSASNRKALKNKPPITKSGYWGVFWDKRGKNWIARIPINGKQKQIGVFQSKENAAQAFNFAAYELYGDLAIFNTRATS